ncbi:MAG: hypothetical protein AAGM22_21665 [Acidobacteriota bacterium]
MLFEDSLTRSDWLVAAALSLVVVFGPAAPADAWPTVSPSPTLTPPTVEEGALFSVNGQGFGDDPFDYALVLRDRDGLGGASATLLDVQDHVLTARLDPVGRHFTGDLELHLIERLPLAGRVVINGPRHYQTSNVYWIQSYCYIDAGPLTVAPPKKSGRLSDPVLPDFLLFPNPTSGIDRLIVISSSPPPCPTHVDNGDSPPVPPSGGFSGGLTITRTEGPEATPEQWRDDLALIIQDAFSSFGLVAVAHPAGLAIGSTSGLTGGFALLMPTEP